VGEVILRWTGDDLQFSGHTRYGDAVAVGGDPDGRGAKPSDLLVVSLAACTAYDVVVILRKQRQDLRGLEIAATVTQDPDPPWTFRAIHLEFRLTGVVDRVRAEKAVELSESKYCAVAATLRPVVELTHSVTVVAADPEG
jgi:putative redox protein